jgi:CheY-like chemotaxis protein
MQVPSSPLRVLVVDDEPLMCWSIAETLGECGDTVTKAESGAAAVRALCGAPTPVDVVLLDYKLPDVQHLNLLMAIRRLSPATRVILMSAHVTPEIASTALALGASAVVNKPIDMHDVPALIHRAGPRSS